MIPRLLLTASWLALVGMLASGCTNDGATVATLRAAGYTQIELTGHDWWSCSDDDGSCTGFRAKGPTGIAVKGAVGCGLFFKGCTIRVTGGGL